MACIEAIKKNIDNLRRQQQKLTEVPITAAAAGGLGTVQSESTDMAAAADRHDTAVEGVYPLICYRICFYTCILCSMHNSPLLVPSALLVRCNVLVRGCHIKEFFAHPIKNIKYSVNFF